jgi:hypothetical protein
LAPAKQRSTAAQGLQFVSLLCVLLIVFAGFAQAIHVHSDSSQIPGHECSICSIAHAGVLGSTIYQFAPLFFLTVLIAVSRPKEKSSGFISSLHIRPPPAA